MKEQLASKKIIFTIIVLFGLVVGTLILIYVVALLGEPKNPRGISNEIECRSEGGLVLESDPPQCQLPDSDPFEIDF